jgi:hypothetical protein
MNTAGQSATRSEEETLPGSVRLVQLQSTQGVGFAHGQALVKVDNEDPQGSLIIENTCMPEHLFETNPVRPRTRSFQVRVDDRTVTEGRFRFGILDVAVDTVTGASYRIQELFSSGLARPWLPLISDCWVMQEEDRIHLKLLINIAAYRAISSTKQRNKYKTNDTRSTGSSCPRFRNTLPGDVVTRVPARNDGPVVRQPVRLSLTGRLGGLFS